MEKAKRRRLFAAVGQDGAIGTRLEALHRTTEIACFEHAGELGFGDDVIRPNGWMWLIAKTEVELLRSWDLDGETAVETIPVLGSATGLLWMAEVFDASGLFARQTYHWVLADQTSGFPLRLPDGMKGDRTIFKTLEEERYAWSESAPKTALFATTRWIDAADLDVNGHVHNTCHVRYAFEACDVWPMRYVVRYLAPLPAARTLTLQAFQDNDFILIKGFVESTAATPAFTVGVRVKP
jgi:acyl-CoA thioesterase FadM